MYFIVSVAEMKIGIIGSVFQADSTSHHSSYYLILLNICFMDRLKAKSISMGCNVMYIYPAKIPSDIGEIIGVTARREK